jgi:hypothetical protein
MYVIDKKIKLKVLRASLTAYFSTIAAQSPYSNPHVCLIDCGSLRGSSSLISAYCWCTYETITAFKGAVNSKKMSYSDLNILGLDALDAIYLLAI